MVGPGNTQLITGSNSNGTEPVVEIQGLSFAYPDGLQALNDIHLTIRAGERVALVGPNGAGKSTLMLHFNGLLGGPETPLLVQGMALTKQDLPAIRALVGLVFQNPDDQLFSPTVLEDVAFGPLHLGLPEAEVRARVTRALEQVGMAGFEARISHNLSAGQKKRVAIATVLAMEPRLLVFDEPTAGLDPRGRRQLIDLLADLPVTMIGATHDLLFAAESFGRMVVLDGGRIVADGPTLELLQDAQLLERHGLESPSEAVGRLTRLLAPTPAIPQPDLAKQAW